MNAFERIGLYGASENWSRKGKERKVLCDELNRKLHPKRRNRRRVNPRRIHTLQAVGLAGPVPGEVGQNAHVRTKGFNSWEEAIREAQTSSGQVETSGRTVSSNLVFLKRSDDLPNQPQAVGRNQ